MILIILFIAIVYLYQISSYRRMRTYVTAELRKPQTAYCPRAAVILPCKGLDPDFKESLKKLIDQNYFDTTVHIPTKIPNFEIIFTVADISDPAYPVLKEVIEENPHIKARLVIAGVNNIRAQKITNQLEALKRISPATEVLVFVDSDVVAKSDFLANLVSPLQDINIGVSTGYRFYLPSQFSFPGLIRSLWNRLSAWELSSKKFAFAWGGAMAIRRSVFEKAGIAKVWDKAADDDLSLTTAVKRFGLNVHFVPRCLVISHCEDRWPEILEWTNRQLVLTKVYYPELWFRGIIRAGIMTGWLLLVVILSIEVIFGHNNQSLPVLLVALSLLFVELIFLYQGHELWRDLLSTDSDKELFAQSKFKKAYENLLWQSATVLPLAHIVLPFITLYSLLTNRISWRGINYELKSPEEIVVI